MAVRRIRKPNNTVRSAFMSVCADTYGSEVRFAEYAEFRESFTANTEKARARL
jgi:hypothetical protein